MPALFDQITAMRSKSRGMGKVRGEVQGMTLHYLGRRLPEPTETQFPICGIGALGDENKLQGYDICPPYQEMAVLPQGVERKPNGLRTTYTFPGDTFPWESVSQAWVDYATRYKPSKAMRAIRGQRDD